MAKITTQQWIERFNYIHNTEEYRKEHGHDHYDYGLIFNVDNASDKLPIKCIKHNFILYLSPNKHFDRKQGCKLCKKDTLHFLFGLTKEKFIEKAQSIHGKNKYDYSKFIYYNNRTKGIIICNTCKIEFEQSPNKHLRKHNCTNKKCENSLNKPKLTHEEFIESVIKIWNDEYEILDVYVNTDTKIKIKHIKCKNIFEKTPYKFIKRKQGCPFCKSSVGEKEISDILRKFRINFEPQKRFSDCRYIKPLPFDFYLPDFNCCIEYQGSDHFPPLERQAKSNPKRFNNEHYKGVELRDQLKKDYCNKNDILLIEIPYWDFNKIEEILICRLGDKFSNP